MKGDHDKEPMSVFGMFNSLQVEKVYHLGHDFTI